jgi:GT2 family glycosyltransferase
MKIGVGVTTYNRPELLKNFIAYYEKYKPDNCVLNIQDDTYDRRGVAFRKNENLRALQDCDYIFLFDDDCYPIKKDWHKYFIKHHLKSGEHHFLYNDPSRHGFTTNFKTDIMVTPNTGGVFMFLTKEVIEKVGAFNEQYGVYGFEHAEYSQRVCKAGLTSFPFQTLYMTSEFIYSKDYSEEGFVSSINESEKKAALENFQTYKDNISKPYFYMKL